MRFLKQIVAVAAISAVGSQGVVAVQDDPWLALPLGVLTAVLAALVYRWVVRRTEHRAPTDLAGPGAVRGLAVGTLIGVAAVVAVLATIALTGSYRITGFGSVGGAVALLGFMAAAAVTEELMFRGVMFRVLEEHAGTWISLLTVSALFGAMHLLNPDASLWGATAIALTGGLMLGASYIATRSLWAPIGLHFGWNVALGGSGAAVSGNGTPDGLLESTLSGSTLITGGDFGPEGSVVTVLTCIALAIVFLWMAQRRGHVRPRRHRQSSAPVLATTSR